VLRKVVTFEGDTIGQISQGFVAIINRGGTYIPSTLTQHNTTQHNTTQHNTTQHNTQPHNTTQHNTTQTHIHTHTHTYTHIHTHSHNVIEKGDIIPPLMRLLKDIFASEATKTYFFLNDLRVLVEVIMREIVNTEDKKVKYKT